MSSLTEKELELELEPERAIDKKTKKANFVVRKTRTFHSDGEKMRNAGNAR